MIERVVHVTCGERNGARAAFAVQVGSGDAHHVVVRVISVGRGVGCRRAINGHRFCLLGDEIERVDRVGRGVTAGVLDREWVADLVVREFRGQVQSPDPGVGDGLLQIAFLAALGVVLKLRDIALGVLVGQELSEVVVGEEPDNGLWLRLA